jgi:hypothetical protein
VDQQPSGQSSPASPPSTHDFFDVYRVAIDDLHRTKNLGQRIDSLYLTIITLLFTADAYEIATSKFDSWVPVIATAGVALIGLAVTARWRQGAANLYSITTNRYGWLRDAENPQKHPEMAEIGANIFTQEFEAVYLPQLTEKARVSAKSSQDGVKAQHGGSKFYRRTLFLQYLCTLIFSVVPLVLAAVTYLALNPTLLHQTILGK